MLFSTKNKMRVQHEKQIDYSYQDDSKLELYKKVASSIDFILYIIKYASQNINKLAENLSELPEPYMTPAAAEILYNVKKSIVLFRELSTSIIPSETLCNEDTKNDFLNLHSAYIAYHYDALILLEHSLFSALMGYYTAAYIELRSVLEDVIRGIIFDLIAIPKYREKVKELIKIKGYENIDSMGFGELLFLLKSKLKNNRPELSVIIFDIINNELKNFNPKTSFAKLLKQLKQWNIINAEIFRNIHDLYAKLSKYVHRFHPNYSEVGKRILMGKDWVKLEPVPQELFTFFQNFIEICGWATYITIMDFSVDLQIDKYYKCIDRNFLKDLARDMEELGRTANSWKFVLIKLKSLFTIR